ncbi:MAG: hypothetical protein A2Y14_00650 [Verrucomicrobia bacterium GWF2_51_19]|nr:MAG: hypothetical protein A2Y14_00650 [Verrucomicrobia bacterium GWF2_51_19]
MDEGEVSRLLGELERFPLAEEDFFARLAQRAVEIGAKIDTPDSPQMRLLTFECASLTDKKLALSLLEGLDLSPTLWLKKAKLCASLQRFDEAWQALQGAIRNGQDSAVLLQAASVFLKKLEGESPMPHKKAVRVALLSSSTTLFLAPLLRAVAFAADIRTEVYEGDFGNYRQAIFGTALIDFQPDFVVLALHWRDFPTDLHVLWATIAEKLPKAVILQYNADLPACPADGYLAYQTETGTVARLRKFNRQLQKKKAANVVIVDIERLSAEQGLCRWNDDALWFQAKQHPSLSTLPALAKHLTSLMQQSLGFLKKVLVLDLDNTLWGGIISEDGLDGIRVGAPSAIGESFSDFQQFVKELKARGILLAVASKNNLEDALLPFQKHDGMVLRREDFLVFCANWGPKSASMKHIAKTLDVGLDSLVFVDDNPHECAEVRQNAPEVTVIQAVYNAKKQLFESLCLDRVTLSDEDKKRHRTYQMGLKRTALKQGATSPRDFLKSLHLEATVRPFELATLARIEQLVQRTNQFNLTTRRHALGYLKSCIDNPVIWARSFKLKDIFGDYGIVGVLVAEKQGRTWSIDTFLLSCRAIGLGLETFMMQTLLDAAKKEGASVVTGTFIPTAKNALASTFYSDVGFADVGNGHYQFLLGRSPTLNDFFIVSS